MNIRVIKNAFLLATLCWQLGACSKNDDSSTPEKTTIRPITGKSSPYVDTVFSYIPAPGQFINTSLGDMASVQKITTNGTITLGAWGGQIVLGFDHSVLNKAGDDLKVTGNAPGTAITPMAEAGIVWVMQDVNGNGLPDDTWYELKGSAYSQPGYSREHSVTYFKPAAARQDVQWKASDGTTGVVKINAFNKQDSYYPDWISTDQYTLTGSILPADHIDATNPALVISKPFDFGYADNTAGGDSMDIDNAIDGNGNAVALKAIDFIKIQTGVMADLGSLGEFSTELSSIQDLNMTIQ